MIEGARAISPRAMNPLNPARLESLRQCINDEAYLRDAIQRIALVLSNELMDISQEEKRHERKRRK